MPSPRSAWLLLHLAVLLVGFAGLFGKWVQVNALMLVAGRLLFAIPALALIVALRARRVAPVARADWWLLGVNGAVLAVHWVSFFHAVQKSTVALALLGYSCAPVFAALLEPAAFRERPSPRAFAASALILAGAAMIVPEWRLDAAVFQGLAWGALSGLTFAVLQLLNRRLVQPLGSLRLALRLDIAALLLLLPSLPFAWEVPSPRDWALVAVQGILFTAVAHTLFIVALPAVKAQGVAIASTLEPVYGIALAAWLLAEIPDARTIAGGVVIFAAVLWSQANLSRRNGPGGAP